jgi:glucose-1-phosphatase
LSSTGKAQVDAVILDLGNVLVFHDNAQLFQTFGRLAGLDGEEVARKMPPALWSAIHLGEVDRAGIRREVCQALEVELDEDEFCRLWNSHFTPNHAVLPWVESLIGRVKLLLLSNTNAIHMEYLIGVLPVLRRFDHLVLSHELKKMKPDPAIFAHALRLAGSAPARTAFFDDLPHFVEAAKRVGIRAFLFTGADEFAVQLGELGLR